MRKYRPLITLLILLTILFLPFYIYLPLLFLACLLLPLYWEAVLLSLLADIFYGSLGLAPSIILKTYSFWTLVLLIALLPLRKIIRNYA